jgi:RHS repeat-associated protein
MDKKSFTPTPKVTSYVEEANKKPEKSPAGGNAFISLPKGGGALKSIDEKFSVNAANGTASFSIPFPLSKSRSEFSPTLNVSYNSGSGNSALGLGWDIDLPSIQRKTGKKLPEYEDDTNECDVFMFSGMEDLVPSLRKDEPDLTDERLNTWTEEYFKVENIEVKRYKPRIEGSFVRIERIKLPDEASFYWKVTTKENITTFFGITDQGRISDPADNRKVFKWLPQLSYDDKGNCFQYEYTEENLLNVVPAVHEKNRENGLAQFSNKYLKRIKYGNKNPYYANPLTPYNGYFPSDPQYFFEAVLDYGDHFYESCQPQVQQPWPCRLDPFSDYRAGFEIRTYRLCKRILMFHHFKELNDGITPAPYLVKSLDFHHRNFGTLTDAAIEADYIISIQQASYRKNDAGFYDKKALPPMEFMYHAVEWRKEIKEVDTENLVHAPIGLGRNYQWIDLWSEGIAGILSEQGAGWFYKRNLGYGNFSAAQQVALKPSFTGLSSGAVQIQDLEANGKKYLVSRQPGAQGYFELSENEQWQPYRHFEKMPTQQLDDPHVKFLDLNGDGMPELLVAEDDVFTWYPSKGTLGYDSAELVRKPFDEEKGPAIVFADTMQSILLADMSGDGLTDIVRVRNGEICYWPNLGYGKFGAKVTMSNSPIFDTPDAFNPSYLHLTDLSGTGATDILYLGNNLFKAWLNLSGNAWGPAQVIDPFLETAHPHEVAVMDFLGNGTGCIVWSSPLPADTGKSLRYIDLMGGKKPHILCGYKNNLGKETSFEYKSSTFYYLEDKKSEKPWITKLPFPVQCVSEVKVRDVVTETLFCNQYSYHHGYYDYVEKEFRGFGRVEQKNTQDFRDFSRNHASNIVEEQFHQPPVLTKTWFHTGAYFNKEKILNQFADEYFKTIDFEERHLPPPMLPDHLSTEELQEALRACKGMTLRQEIYALDGTDKSAYPYSTAEHNCIIKLVQPKDKNSNAVFFVHESEAITYHYERDLADPRIAHTFNLQIDEYGNVEKSISIVYGRRGTDTLLPDQISAGIKNQILQEQQKDHVKLEENDFTNDIISSSVYRLRQPCQQKSFELTGITSSDPYFSLQDLNDALRTASFLPYEQLATSGVIQKRIIEHKRILYTSDDVSTPLPFGEIGALGISYESYQLAFTEALLTVLYNHRVTPSMLTEGKYLQSEIYKTQGLFPSTDNNNDWWIRSGQVIFPENPSTHFYLPVEYRDPYNTPTKIKYYDDYHLLIHETEDALGNKTNVVDFDFRIMAPTLVKDQNDNYSQVRFDILGMVVGIAAKGKGDEADDLENFTADLTPAQTAEFFEIPTIHGSAILQHASGRFVYDFSSLPVKVASIVRETQYQDTLDELTHTPRFNSKLQYSFEYSDGSGNVVMKKVQAEPGVAKKVEDDAIIEIDTTPDLRWVGNGRTILNNKGKPVKQYEPYFSPTHRHETARALVEIGVSPVIFYDPLGRAIRTEMPDGTSTKIEFSNWLQRGYDQNDTVLISAWYAARTTGSLRNNRLENIAAQKAAIHANTPTIEVLDALGRPFYSFTHNKFKDHVSNEDVNQFIGTHIIIDIEGNQRKIFDANENVVMEYKYDMLGNQTYQKSMDAGERWLLQDCTQKPSFAWDSKQQRFHTRYDLLHRPIQHEVTFYENPGDVNSNQITIAFEKFIYGEELPDDKQKNLRGQLVTHYDSAGITQIPQYDFKGDPLSSSWQFTRNYKDTPDWTVPTSVTLLEDVYISSAKHDALKRPIEIISPDGSITRNVFSESNFLNQVTVSVKGGEEKTFVRNIDHDAKGQRERIEYAQTSDLAIVTTTYKHDPLTYRLTQLRTVRLSDNKLLQDLYYTYDPVGNITAIKDLAQQDVYFNNTIVEPLSEYEYNASYQLIKASGREHAAGDRPVSAYDEFRMQLAHKADATAMQNYNQYYEYDFAGNMKRMIHTAGRDAFTNRWTRSFEYKTHLADSTQRNNQLLSSAVGTNVEHYTYDIHGNMLGLPHLPVMNWNFKDHLSSVDLQGGGKAYYVYDAQGQRIRKVVEKLDGTTEERLYLGIAEFYHKCRKDSSDRILETLLKRETLHVMDDKTRIALIDTRTFGVDDCPEQLTRLQFSNHLGSASLELDHTGTIISYEEYYPFGSTSFQSGRSLVEVKLKRYRYTSKERDEENGLYYHGARYYAPWLARWTAADPIGMEGGPNVYSYVLNNPAKYHDPTGTDIHISPYSRLSARQIVTLIHRQTSIPAYLRNAFQVNPNDPHSIRVNEPRVPRGAQVPEWFRNIQTASAFGAWTITTAHAEINADTPGSRLTPDSNGDPSYNATQRITTTTTAGGRTTTTETTRTVSRVEGTNETVLGHTSPSQDMVNASIFLGTREHFQVTSDNVQISGLGNQANATITTTSASLLTIPGIATPGFSNQGLIVVANRATLISRQRPSISASLRSNVIVGTFLHELAVHAYAMSSGGADPRHGSEDAERVTRQIDDMVPLVPRRPVNNQ